MYRAETKVQMRKSTCLAVLLSACLPLIWWCLSCVKDDVQGELNSSMSIAVNGKALQRQHQIIEVSVLKDNGTTFVNAERLSVQAMQRLSPASATYSSAVDAFVVRQSTASSDAAQAASDMNDVMDGMLNRSEIPADYAETMVALFSDKSRGDVIRDFAVQHIGLYAETLQMRGKYDSDSSESATLRDALWDAAEETRTIVAVAAFRAIADMAVFDPRIDVNRLDSRLASCIADSYASPAARVMAAQLCGERRVVAAKSALSRLAADRRESEPLRLAAANSARLLAE